MKKIIVPFEGTAYRPELPEFARLLNSRSRILLSAAFVPELDYALLATTAGGTTQLANLHAQTVGDIRVARNRQRFKRFCEDNEIDFSLREDHADLAVPAILRETRFADLLLLSSAHFFETIGGRQPNGFMRELLHDTECPVMLLPDEPRLPGELVFAYDGSASSTHAIRQFAYLFPEFTRLRTTLVFLYDNNEAEVPDESFIRELGNRHFKHFRLLRLSRRTDDFYDTWIRLMDNPWLICGAFARSEWSLLFARSFATRMIGEHNVPLFIAHA